MMLAPLRTRLIYIAIASVCTALYMVLGYFITVDPLPPIDRDLSAWAGHGIEIAWICTNSALLPELATIGIAALIFGFIKRAWLLRSIFAAMVDFAAWVTSDACKLLFHRRRPPHWFYHHETSFSYSSGHATHALIVYGLWAFFFWRSSLPLAIRATVTITLGLWVLAISWSRIALGAHYATDVLGGWLLGIVVLSVGFAIAPQVLETPMRKKIQH